MSPEVMALILVGSFVLLLAIGAEVFVALGITAIVGLVVFIGQPETRLARIAFDSANSFILTCLPLFIFMGALFGTTGVIDDLIRAVDKFSSSLPGGVAASVTIANAIFGAMSGSQIAAVAVFGKACFPPMERLGYDPKFALGSIAVGGTLAGIIPPSMIFIIYGVWMNVSVVRLFAAGLIPGIILALLIVLLIMVRVKLNPRLAPRPPEFTRREKLISLVRMLPFAAVILVVLGTIFSGVMTPTESAALGAFISIVLALGYRKMSLRALEGAMRSAVTITTMVLFIVIAARSMSLVFHHLGVIDIFSTLMLNLPLGRYGIFAIVCVMYLIMGMFMDSVSILLLTFPFVGPLIAALGFNPIWFAVSYALLASIGLVTPPFGLTLFVLSGVVPKYDVMTVARGCAPFLIPLFLTLAIVVAVPETVLWLPGVLYG